MQPNGVQIGLMRRISERLSWSILTDGFGPKSQVSTITRILLCLSMHDSFINRLIRGPAILRSSIPSIYLYIHPSIHTYTFLDPYAGTKPSATPRQLPPHNQSINQSALIHILLQGHTHTIPHTIPYTYTYHTIQTRIKTYIIMILILV